VRTFDPANNGNGHHFPLLVFDGECGFCRIWVDYWRRLTGDRVSYAPYQEVSQQFPQVSLAEFHYAVQLFLPDGRVLSGAHAVFRAIAHAPGQGWLLWLYQNLWGFPALAQVIYRFVSAHRSFFYYPTRLLYGQHLHPMNSTSTQERGGSKGPSHRDSEESVSHPRAERYWYGRC